MCLSIQHTTTMLDVCVTPNHHITTLFSTIPLMPCHLSAPYTYGILYSLTAISMAQFNIPRQTVNQKLDKIIKSHHQGLHYHLKALLES